MGSKAMTQGMGRHRRHNANLLDIVLDDQPQALARQPLAAMVEKECGFAWLDNQLRASRLQIIINRL